MRFQNALLLVGSLGLLLLVSEALIRAREDRLIGAQIERLGIHVGAVEAETWQPWRQDGQGLFHVRSPDRRLVYESRPNARVTLSRGGREVVIATNSSGFRDDEFSRQKPPGVFRIAAVGDSVTIGLFFDRAEIYPDIVERLLDAEAPEACAYEVYNLGVTGYNVEQEVELIRARVTAFDPDLILVGYVFNDDEVGQDAGLWAHFSRTPLRTWDFLVLRWLELSQRLRRSSLTERSFAELAAWAEPRKIPILVVIFPLLDRGGGEYRHRDRHARLRAVAERSGFAVLDLLDAFAAGGALDKNDGDILHPTAEGHRVAARQIADLVLSQPGYRCDATR